MHTLKTDNGTIFHHDGGFLGDVHIVRNNQQIEIPFDDMLLLVSEFIRNHHISELENMSPIQILLRN